MSNKTPKARKNKPKRPALSAREIAFSTHYFEHGCASDAYRHAGYPKCEPESTWTLACRVLRKPAVQAFIWELRDQACEAALVNANRIVRGLARAAFADRRQLWDAKGCLKLPHEWPDDVASVVEGADGEQLFEWVTEVDPETKKRVKKKVLKGFTTKVKTAKQLEALKVLAQWKRMIGPDVPALEILLGALPPDYAAVVRDALARALRGEEDSGDQIPPVKPGAIGGEASLDSV